VEDMHRRRRKHGLLTCGNQRVGDGQHGQHRRPLYPQYATLG
jgi:hypothetical protein